MSAKRSSCTNAFVEVTDKSVYLEEYARGQIAQEELHTIEILKMLRDYET